MGSNPSHLIAISSFPPPPYHLFHHVNAPLFTTQGVDTERCGSCLGHVEKLTSNFELALDRDQDVIVSAMHHCHAQLHNLLPEILCTMDGVIPGCYNTDVGARICNPLRNGDCRYTECVCRCSE